MARFVPVSSFMRSIRNSTRYVPSARLQAHLALSFLLVQETKARLAQMPKGKQFNFDEGVIFGKFTLFRRRLEKIEDMFSSIKQFQVVLWGRVLHFHQLILSLCCLHP